MLEALSLIYSVNFREAAQSKTSLDIDIKLLFADTKMNQKVFEILKYFYWIWIDKSIKYFKMNWIKILIFLYEN